MRRIITGIDESGRSCVVDEEVFDADPTTVDLVQVFATTEVPPGPRPAGAGEFRDLGVAPGGTQWMLVHWPPNVDASGMHHTDTVDYDVVLSGSVELLLDDGAHHLGPGDCAVVTGVDHGWRAGPDGAVMSVTLVGSTPPQ